ncbi:uncharacterized protein LOC131607167 [Vicia villosa]|uniref:uncharacterized protein LOC131607167 n=1 Tax=Vicia villosa TaxID=3911 RepID=UPI00273C9D29|nr:uncharacterized protein LOC131607167 [Vicia villosa]
MDRALLAESSVERGRQVKSKRKRKRKQRVGRKNVEDEPVYTVERGLKSERNHVEGHMDVVERGSRLKSKRNHVEGDLADSRLKKPMKIKIAEADYHRRPRCINLNPFDACPPSSLWLQGGVCPFPITESSRHRLVLLCETALKKYNKRNNQGPKFEFEDLVKSNCTLPGLFFITFKAKKKQDGSTAIFQAEVFRNFSDQIRVMSCAIKN